ncbi:MAG: hypothetical protein LQ345_000052 [Seirophora villosa]|nr:MAG: hypothetical protein LQ345_000052 [Seirophora villosa]
MLSSVCTSGQGLAPQKLSKPQTNRSSSNLLAATQLVLEPVSPHISSDADSTDGYFPQMASTNGERRPRQNTRSKIRSYLYGQSHETGRPHSSEDDESTPTSFATVVKRRLSRTDSSTLLQTSGLGASAASSTSRLFLPDATVSDPDVDEVMKEQIKEKVWTDTLAAQNHVSSPVDEDKHPDSVMTPIRRRSLYTPGIATRSPEDILRKPPPPVAANPQAERDYYYNPALSESSPLSRLAKLRASNTGRSTPSELDYTHLGAMKLGTLRVTNGAASPVPRIHDNSPVPTSSLDTASPKDFHSASEGGRSEDSLRSNRSSQSSELSCARERRSIDMVSSPTPFPPGTGDFSIHLEPSMQHCAPSMRCEPNQSYSIGNSDSVAGHRMTADCKTIKRKPLPSAATRGHQSHASSIAMDCATDIPGNHYPDASDWYRVPEGTITSRPQAAMNPRASAPPRTQAMDPEVWRAFIRAAEQRHADNGSRDEALSKLTGSHRAQVARGGGADGLLQQGPFVNGRDAHHVDSGYSSNMSLKSTASNPISCVSSPRQERPPTDLLPEVPAQPETGRISHHETFGHGCDEAPSFLQGSHKRSDLPTNSLRGRSLSSSEKPSPQQNPPQEPLPSPEKSRKLQKKRPKSQPPLQRLSMSAAEDDAGHEIPPVPTAMINLHFERAMNFPLLDHTYPSLEDTTTNALPRNSGSFVAEQSFPLQSNGSEDPCTRDKPSLFQKLASRARSRSRSRPREKKLLYESDEESIKSEICRSPSWSEYGNKKKKEQKKKVKAEREIQQRRRRESSANGNPGSENRSRSRSRFRSSRRPVSQHEPTPPTPTLTDFGAVQESLGVGPSDIATSRLSVACQSASKGIPARQIGPAKPRTHGSNELHENNDEYGRHRSHSLAGLDLLNEDASRVSRDVRPKPARPYSMFFDRAPAPSPPMAECPMSDQGNNHSMSTGPGAQLKPNHSQTSPAMSMLDLRQLRDNTPKPRKTSPAKDLSPARVDAFSIQPAGTMEELLDKLLDAPDAETKESILEQMRQLRRGLVNGLQSTPKLAGGANLDASRAAGTLRQSTPSRPSFVEDKKHATTTASACTDGHSHLFADAPPMPPVPSAADIQQKESRRSVSKYEQSRTLTRPQVQAPEMSKPDLWAGCAMETEHKKASKPSSDWDSHQLAWSHRRRSAGETLLLKGRPFATSSNAYRAECSDAPPELAPVRPIPRATLADLEQTCGPPNDSKAFHKPWPPRDGQQEAKDYSNSPTSSLQADSKVLTTAQAFERLSGRFEGGLQYGYEPGFGLGGSAGMRSTKNGATRKSVHVSQGFGVDLSDVPVFVAPSK